ncbi:Re/Si-specific NAD(P)(+) transhydrogenase subunit alpha [Streptomyces sp. JH14]|uniref:Re/Si-specific NAD(P)(+) transhydrogenase subunit alpha n=1 Tax=Streptomyces sp. JH14 TaxID=2793630 RepID=UPI0023F7B339|nr:Re/Si-specific NAD(P)(+) transhydrogenase subunit alpha [Streptomyces sp. JH14]MDF6046133.1 Re/Si-specific NAD(P)(+) transhydrogenase subunit alpha [Streptomyces sp. JH14]
MIIGVLKEARSGETRVAATPETVGRLLGLGYEVVVEQGAGLGSDFSDRAYFEAGASIAPTSSADVVLGVNAPSPDQLAALKPGATLVSILGPALDPALVEDLAGRPITALAMDAVPRISRAQSLDVLSSMANIAGYRAVIEAAHLFGRFFTGQVTAAGKVPPAQVLVVGAGVAGLAAIGAAGSLGAVVRATDPRPEVADQVRSLGAEFLSVATARADENNVSATGYATPMSDDYSARAERLYGETVPGTDIVITTALIPGRPAPRLITAEMVTAMRPGSVIVDMAAANGGNVEGTVPGEAVVTENGVTIVGYTDLAGRLPAQASQLYGTNLVNLIRLLTPGKDGELVLDFSDVVQRAMTVVRYQDGKSELTWPPPPVQVSAATPSPAAVSLAPVAAADEKAQLSVGRLLGGVLAAATVFFALVALAPPALEPHLVVFALAIVIGYYVIGKVHHALHTPLMSVTNAISGIIVVGAMLTLVDDARTVVVLATAATLLASVNVFGGFAVTRRMLAMFSRS